MNGRFLFLLVLVALVSGALPTRALDPLPTGPAGSPNALVLSVQGIPGGSGVLTSASNGAGQDTAHDNWNSTLADGGTKTVTFSGATQTNYDARGVTVIITVTAVSGSGATLTPQIQVGDGAGNFAGLLGASLALTTAGTYLLTAYPGAISQTGVASLPLPRVWRVAWSIAGTSPSFTFSATAAYVK